ncbi:MAG: MFS transporter [candidate division WOR-3 bacterium]
MTDKPEETGSPAGTQVPAAHPERAFLSDVLPRTFSALRIRDFRLYWFGQLISFIGTWMQNIAANWLILDLTGSAFFVGLNSTLTWMPSWLLTLPAGVLADRLNKRNIMIVTQSTLAILALLLAVLTWTGTVTVTHILAIGCLAGFVVAVNSPVVQAIIPELVRGRDILNAVALNSIMFNSARIIGPSAAGVVLGALGPGACFGLNSLSFLAIIIPLALIRLSPPQRSGDIESPWGRMLSGLNFVRHNTDIRTLILLVAVFSSLGVTYLPLLPVYAREVFSAGPRGYGLMMAMVGIGAVAGGLTIATLSRTRHRGRILLTGSTIFGVLLVGLSFTRSFGLGLLLLALIGFCQANITSLSNTLIQTLTPDHIRGRVMSVFVLAFNGMFPLGSFFAGSIAQQWGAPAATLVGGSGVLTSIILVSLLRPQLRAI